jgi:hypothetical protein
VPAGLETLLGLEADASRLEVFSASIIYGLLQTEEYARVTIGEGRFADPDPTVVDNLVALRMHRQSLLLGDTPPNLASVIDESALRRVVGGRSVMRDQVAHVIEVSEYPQVTIQVLPNSAGAHAAQTGSFLHLTFPCEEDPDLVYCDGAAGNQYVKKPDNVRKFVAVFHRLQGQALPAAQTRRFLEELYKEYR